jgi:hypothetical protein
MLIAYTTPNSVRVLLGVTENELSDTVLNDSFYALSLKADLYRVCATIEVDYAAAAALDEADADALRFADAVRLFATYVVAKTCLASLPQFAVRSSSDGKASFLRHTSTSFDNSILRVEMEYNRAKAALLDQYALYLPGAVITELTSRDFIQVSLPSFDPVTGT